MAQPMIELKDLSKAFRTDSGDVVALDHVNLQIGAGEIFGVIGMSGAGKTTLVRCMNFLERPTDGEVWIDGENLARLDAAGLRRVRQQESMIFQHFNLLMQKTVAENVRFSLDIAGIKGAEAKERVRELLDVVGLPDKADSYPSQLSGGQKQRVAIARSLASNPKILLCDEATSALDPMTTRSILDLIRDINAKMGITIVIITHEMSVIREVCTRVAVMDGARVVEEGTVKEVFTRPKTSAALRLFYSSDFAAGGTGKRRVRIVFDGSQVDRPILAEAITACGAPINIFHANLEQIGGMSVGQMIVELPADENAERMALDYLRSQDLVIEEVRGDAI